MCKITLQNKCDFLSIEMSSTRMKKNNDLHRSTFDEMYHITSVFITLILRNKETRMNEM